MRHSQTVRFFTQQEGEDDYGNEIQGWAGEPFLTVRAAIEYSTGSEAVQAAALVARQAARIKFRAGSVARTISEGDRAVIAGQAWNIRSIVWVGRGQRQVELVVERDGTDG